MLIEKTLLSGVVVITPARFGDHRGFFSESYNRAKLVEHGINLEFVQDNHSRSSKGVVRGLHFQHQEPMGKLMICLRGAVQLVEVDIRRESPTFGQHVSMTLDDTDGRMVWVPPGFANGFCVLSDVADVLYKCTAYYNASGEGGIHPMDPALGITWMAENPVLSQKDLSAPLFAQYATTPTF